MSLVSDYRNLDYARHRDLSRAYNDLVEFYVPTIIENIEDDIWTSGCATTSGEIECALDFLEATGIFDDEELRMFSWICQDPAPLYDFDDEDVFSAYSDPACEPFWKLHQKVKDALEIWEISILDRTENDTCESVLYLCEWAGCFVEKRGLESAFAALEAGVPVEDILA